MQSRHRRLGTTVCSPRSQMLRVKVADTEHGPEKCGSELVALRLARGSGRLEGKELCHGCR